MDVNTIEIIIVIQALFFACASEAVAASKKRDSAGYFVLGLFLGIIGLLITVGVPRLEESEAKPIAYYADARYLDRSSNRPRLVRGRIYAREGQFGFEGISKRDQRLELDYRDVSGIWSFRFENAPDIPLKKELLKQGNTGLAIQLHNERGRYVLYFALSKTPAQVMKRRISAWRDMALASAEKKCPYCAEMIKAVAIKCKHCTADLIETPAAPTDMQIAAVASDTMKGEEFRPLTTPPLVSLAGAFALTDSHIATVTKDIVTDEEFRPLTTPPLVSLLGEFALTDSQIASVTHDAATDEEFRPLTTPPLVALLAEFEAFSEPISPNSTRPEYQQVVLGQPLNKRVRLSDEILPLNERLTPRH